MARFSFSTVELSPEPGFRLTLIQKGVELMLLCRQANSEKERSVTPLNLIYGRPTVKKDRDAAFFSYTRLICPKCKKVIDAHIVLRDDRVWMQKKCTSSTVSLEFEISSDTKYYVKSLSYTKPGTIPLKFSTRVKSMAVLLTAGCVKTICSTPALRSSRSTTSAT